MKKQYLIWVFLVFLVSQATAQKVHLQGTGSNAPGTTSLALNQYKKLDGLLNQLVQGDVSDELICRKNNQVLVAIEHQENARPAILNLGLQVTTKDTYYTAGWISVDKLVALNALQNVKSIRHLPKLKTGLGLVDNQAAIALKADVIAEQYRLNGKGLRIGILSSSFALDDSAYQASILSGDLPGPGNPNGFTQPVEILREGDPSQFGAGASDEGRAMAELIHDIAPGATLVFAGLVDPGSRAISAGIDTLVAAGCHIIADDVISNVTVDPYYMDGRTAQTIDDAVAQGVHYFVSAGNDGRGGFTNGRRFYEAPITQTEVLDDEYVAHVFEGENGVDQFWLPFVLRDGNGNGRFDIDMRIQWSDSWGTEVCDSCETRDSRVDILVYEISFNNGFTVDRIGTATTNVEGAWNTAQFNLPPGAVNFNALAFSFAIPQDLPVPERLLITYNGSEMLLANSLIDVPVNAPTIYGKSNTENSLAIATSSWFNTPEGAELWNDEFQGLSVPNPNGGQPLVVPAVPVPEIPILSTLNLPRVTLPAGPQGLGNTPSSYGGAPLLFDDLGNPLAQPLIRNKPDLTATDVSENTFFGQQFLNLPGRFFFYGTSAAAPNAAATAALLLQASNNTLSPAQLENILVNTALDLDDSYENGLQQPGDPLFATGFDFASGNGFIQADSAIEEVIDLVGLQSLTLAAECKAGSEARFLIQNPNGYGLEVELTASGGIRLENEQTAGASTRTFTVAPGDNYIFTPLIAGRFANATLEWQPLSYGVGIAVASKFGGWTNCGTNARTLAENTTEEENTEESAGLIIYPNPSRDGRFSLLNSFTSAEKLAYTVLDLNGRVVLRDELENNGERKDITINNGTPGIYIMKLEVGNKVITKKLIID